VNYLDTLNPKQKEAVLQTEGPVLIVAGAGAGKTKTLTCRIMRLIENGVSPENILAITFTNKAGKEMRERVYKMLTEDSDLFLKVGKRLPFVSTFHSLGVYIIKENSEILGLPRHFNILDKNDSKKILKTALENIGVEPKEHLDSVCSIISSEKSRGVDFKEFNQRQTFDFKTELTKKIWKIYEDVKEKEKSLDFDDLLLKTLKLLKTNEKVREYYQDRFKYIHIDEYQDTNKIQDEIVHILSFKHQNICAVGDPDQSIYEWRGADIKNMIHFEKKYKDCKVILLEQNYRSTKTILKVANDVINKNKQRIPKNLFTENEDGKPISIFEGFSETDEAHFIASKCKELVELGFNENEIAVLYRANFQSRILEEAFLAYGLKYQMLGTKFFERKEIKDCMSYLKASLNEDNRSDFFRIINVPARGIGKTTIDKLSSDQEDIPAKTMEKILNFKGILQKIKIFSQTNKPSDIIRFILDISGIKKELENSQKEEDLERLENLMELVSLATNYDKQENSLDTFLTDVSLLTDEEEMKEDKGGIKLMTVHASKGLEFKLVFIAGLEEDLFPHRRFKEDKKDDDEEERRLFYVALTRAREKIFISFTNYRTIFGEKKVNSPSRFLEDIDSKYKDYEKPSLLSITKPKTYYSIDF
jgi:DNA helicase-2/ATP-dependent DNA helicase PcrA